MCDGDARNALNSLQMALQAKINDDEGSHISLGDIQDGIKVCSILSFLSLVISELAFSSNTHFSTEVSSTI